MINDWKYGHHHGYAGITECSTEEKEGEEGSASKEKGRMKMDHMDYILVYW